MMARELLSLAPHDPPGTYEMGGPDVRTYVELISNSGVKGGGGEEA